MKYWMHWIIMLMIGGAIGAFLGGRFGWKGDLMTVLLCAVVGAAYPQRLLWRN